MSELHPCAICFRYSTGANPVLGLVDGFGLWDDFSWEMVAQGDTKKGRKITKRDSYTLFSLYMLMLP